MGHMRVNEWEGHQFVEDSRPLVTKILSSNLNVTCTLYTRVFDTCEGQSVVQQNTLYSQRAPGEDKNRVRDAYSFTDIIGCLLVY